MRPCWLFGRVVNEPHPPKKSHNTSIVRNRVLRSTTTFRVFTFRIIYRKSEKPATPTLAMSPTRQKEGTVAPRRENKQPVEILQGPSGSFLSFENTESKLRDRLSSFYHHYSLSRVFENRGSTARDHLASERTFLAYIRTSLALATTGVALVQLLTLADLSSRSFDTPLTDIDRKIRIFARPLGIAFVLLSLAMLATGLFHFHLPPLSHGNSPKSGVYRYFTIQASLPDNMFPVARFSVVFYTFMLSALMVVVFGALIGRT